MSHHCIAKAEPFDYLLSKSADNWPIAFCIIELVPHIYIAGRSHAAEAILFFNDCHLHPEPRGTDGGENASTAPSHYGHVNFADNRQFPTGFFEFWHIHPCNFELFYGIIFKLSVKVKFRIKDKMRKRYNTTAFLISIIMTVVSVAHTDEPPIIFEDVTEKSGLAEHLEGWELAHGAAWGDVTGNDLADLYVGAFADRPIYDNTDAPIPNMLFINEGEKFTLSDDEAARYDTRGMPRHMRARVSMALFADLNDSGGLDLLIGTHSGAPKRLLENRWPDAFRDVTPESGDWPDDFHMRNASIIDLDEDGLLDLVFIDGRYGGGGQQVKLLKNRGSFTFEDVSREYGMSSGGTRGLGSAVGDVNNNGRLDFFIPHSNRLFISREDGTYEEHDSEVFQIEGIRMDQLEWPCGAAFADLTGNGLLDLAVTIHGTAHRERFPNHVFIYLNRGIDSDGNPEFEDVTEEAGLAEFRLPPEGKDLRDTEALEVEGDSPARLPLKAAQIALEDLDNNGRRDILLGMVHKDSQGGIQPVVLRNTEIDDGIPRFEYPPVDGILGYYSTAPVTDYDRDGRMDIFMAAWFRRLGSFLFRNVTEGGNHLVVRVQGKGDELNSMGIGATVRLYKSGHADDEDYLLGRGDITLGNGYSVGGEAKAHFGLGEKSYCDVVITWQGHRVVLNNVEANQYLTVPVGNEGQ